MDHCVATLRYKRMTGDIAFSIIIQQKLIVVLYGYFMNHITILNFLLSWPYSIVKVVYLLYHISIDTDVESYFEHCTSRVRSI